MIGAIFRKSLSRKDLTGATGPAKEVDAKEEKDSEQKSAGADIGKILSLMSSDANAISSQLLMMGFLLIGPFELVIATTFLYRLLGYSAAAGLIVVVVALPFNYLITKLEIKIEKGTRIAKDARMTAQAEIIEHSRTLKYFCWESVFLDKVFKARDVGLA